MRGGGLRGRDGTESVYMTALSGSRVSMWRRHTPTVVVVLALLVGAGGLSSCGGGPNRAASTVPTPKTTTTTTLPTTVLAAPAGANPATGMVGPLTAPGGPFLLDRYGRTVLMHGVNLVYKVPPYEVEVQGTGPDVLTPAAAQHMAALGFDVVRLGIIWKGLEPGTGSINNPAICTKGTPKASDAGQFNASVFDAYLNQLDSTVALLAQYGIYSLIDMHQDVYNEAFGGEGAPDWAVCTDGITPRPQFNVPDWSVNLHGPGVVTAYTHFWRNDVVGNLQGEFDSIWARVASHFRNNPSVIGYDPFNEPYGQGLPPAGSGAAFDGALQCFYVGRANPVKNQAGKTITCPPADPREGEIPRNEGADPNHLVFYEGNYVIDSGLANHIGPMPFPHLVLNFHDYCFLHVPNGGESSNYATVCGPQENTVFTERAAERSHDATPEQPDGPPWLLTEFGATTDTTDLARIMADADAHLSGWMYWEWINYDDPTGSHTSGLSPPNSSTAALLDVLSRPYASAVAGTPLAMSFDPTSRVFLLSFRPDHRISEPTVVFVPVTMHYPNGYCATVTGAQVTSAPNATYLDVESGGHGSEVTVSITPGSC